MLIAGLLVALLWMAINTLLNVGFVYLEEDSPLFSESAKTWLVVVFGLTHETFDHLVAPWVVWLTIGFMPASHLTPEAVHTWIVGLELSTSAIGPLLAFVFASEGCLLNYVLPSEVLPTTTTVDRVFCALYSVGTSSANVCREIVTVPTTVSYTTPFEFNGERCVSSVITLYTSAFLMVFALRIVLLYPLWWIQENRPGWVTPGLHHLHHLYEDDNDDHMHKLHHLREQIEDNTFGINTLAIGLCAGMASPFVAVAAFVCLAVKHTMYSWLDSAKVRRPVTITTDAVPMLAIRADVYEDERGDAFNDDDDDDDDVPLLRVDGAGVRSPPQMLKAPAFPAPSLNAAEDAVAAETDGVDEEEGGFAPHGAGEHEAPFPLPAGSIASVLAVTMLYFVVFMAANGLPWSGLVISLLSGISFGVACRCFR